MNEERFWNLLAKKIAGEASAEEIAELESLLTSHPDFSFPAQQITDVWQAKRTGNTLPTEDAFQKHWQKLQTSTAEGKAPGRLHRTVWMGSLLLFLALGGLFLFTRSSIEPAKPLSQKAEISTQKGDRTKLVLPDSSEVWLNSGSKLSYEPGFGVSNRTATLTGEAFFDVKKSTVPFIVHAGGVRIKVLGTAFNVKSYPNEQTTETSLIRGRVEVWLNERPAEPIVLKPAEKLIVDSHPVQEKKAGQKGRPIVVIKGLTQVSDSLIAETCWMENKLVFADETFEEVARKMERWYNVAIAVKDPALAQSRVGGGPFQNETVEQALNALQIAFDFKFTRKNNYVTVTR